MFSELCKFSFSQVALQRNRVNIFNLLKFYQNSGSKLI